MSDEKDEESLGDSWADALAEQQDEAGDSAVGSEEQPVEPPATDQGSATEAGKAEADQAQLSGGGSEQGAKPQSKGTQQTVELDEFDPAATEPGSGGEDEGNIDVILDIPVTLSMEIGRTQISIRHLLQLNQGSVVELDRLAGEPLDVMVNGTLIAHGEVVVVNERFGIRLTDVISPAERVKKLR
ncbi:flagellar motor switch protein FliN [Halorhodospira halochloris]|uniref:flagellar motor switch protein FliN n=1 Tax=Halorhodospira halochloris TaxID=1052 RepID=UPI001EE90176|nr:flagellar motor switch protein FliN [Halorhodospira halochloris]MCG5548260.1 flagellar motor switch protein FliN [Halorhodospira halochloris]